MGGRGDAGTQHGARAQAPDGAEGPYGDPLGEGRDEQLMELTTTEIASECVG